MGKICYNTRANRVATGRRLLPARIRAVSRRYLVAHPVQVHYMVRA